MKVLEFIATGSEEIETLIPLDIMRRAGIDFKTVSITGSKNVETSHGVTIVADLLFEDADIDHADDAGDDASPESDRRCFGKAARVAYVLRKRPNNRSPAVVVHLRLCLVLYEVEDE